MIEKLRIDDHAADRYVERVKPLLDRLTARAEIERLLPMSREIEFPSWLEWENMNGETAIELSDGIVAIARNGVIVTVCIRGSMKPKRRERRNKRKSSRRHAGRSGNFRRTDRRPTPEWNPDE